VLIEILLLARSGSRALRQGKLQNPEDVDVGEHPFEKRFFLNGSGFIARQAR
jgi:hypothetical protein